MQITAEQHYEEAMNLVSTLDEALIKQMTASEIQTRKQAIQHIISPLNHQGEKDKNIFQILPIAFLRSGLLLESLFFLRDAIEAGHHFDITTIHAVIEGLSQEKIHCIHDGDTQAAEVILGTLKSLYNVLLSDTFYKNTTQVYHMIAGEREANGDYLSAIELYNASLALDEQDIETYMFLGNAYQNIGKVEMSASIFDVAYQISGDSRFLARYIATLAHMGKYDEAYMYYQHLRKVSSSPVNPFVVYLGTIRNDTDLGDLEDLIKDYIVEPIFEPSTILAELEKHASLYIANEFEKESQIIQSFSQVSIDDWTHEMDIEYSRAIMRRLWLMQIHIITLGNGRYLEFYIQELQQYIQHPGSEAMLSEYFATYFSKQAFSGYQIITGDKDSHHESMSIYESIRIHLSQIHGMYAHFEYSDVIEQHIIPLMTMCFQKEGIDDADNNELQESLRFIQQYEREFEALPQFIRESYYSFVRNFDATYGMLYRRVIQCLAHDPSWIPVPIRNTYIRELKKNPENKNLARMSAFLEFETFCEYPDIALLFLIELALSEGEIGFEIGSEESGQLFDTFRLYLLTDEEITLGTSILYQRLGMEEDIAAFIINQTSHMMEHPRILSMVLLTLYYVDDDEALSQYLENINQAIQEDYQCDDIFHYTSMMSDDVLHAKDTTDVDMGEMLFALALSKILAHGDLHEITLELHAAGNYGCTQAYQILANLYFDNNNTQKAVEVLYKAVLQNPNMRTYSGYIDALIVSGEFEEAEKVIQEASYQGYHFPGFVLMLHISRGDLSMAMSIFLEKCAEEDGFMQIPSGVLETLQQYINHLDHPLTENQIVTHIPLKIQASYLALLLQDVSHDQLYSFELLQKHMANIATLFECIDEQKRNTILVDIAPTLLQNFSDYTQSDTVITGAFVIHTHLSYLHHIFSQLHKKNQEIQDKEKTMGTFQMIQYINMMGIMLMGHFPDAHTEKNTWREAVNFLPIKQHLGHIYPLPLHIQ